MTDTKLTAEQLGELEALSAEVDRLHGHFEDGGCKNMGLAQQLTYAEEALGAKMAEHRLSLIAAARASLESRGDAASPVRADMETISANVHESWVASKFAAGITSRKSESGEELMVPYAQLSEAAKELDRVTVRTVLAAMGDVPSVADTESMAGWVRCEDAMPELFALVQFAAADAPGPTLGKFNGHRWMALFDLSTPGLRDYAKGQVTHWAPLLPSPPKVTP